MNRFIVSEKIEVDPEVLGRGAFGVVMKGVWNTNKYTRSVALKFFKNDKGCAQECGVMSGLHHANIVKLYGWSKINGRECLVLEFMNRGSMLTVIKSTKFRNLDDRVDLVERMLLDVARGMEYLEDRGIVHRDIAARNVLIDYNDDATYTAKVSDFGLARGNEYYETGMGMWWAAPEVQEGHRHTSASDVWSFGILMWEGFTFGQKPFHGVNDFWDRICSERPLERPRNCPSAWYEWMKCCVEYSPHNRPDFEDLVKYIENYLF